MPSLFDPVRLGALRCPNRVVMAPMTRARATRDHVPTPVMAEYYAQRASAGLIVSEATGISRQIRKVFRAPLVLNSDYDGARAEGAVEGGEADAISFGRAFIANPDLPARLKACASLTKDLAATWYSRGREGYVGYPALETAAG